MDAAAERELVQRCREGSDAAFRQLIDEYKTLVFALIRRMAPDRSRTEDLAQEVFLKVHRGLPYFRGQARLSTWIYRIVLNVCATARGERPSELSLDSSAVESRSVREPGSVDRTFTDFELRDRVEKALAQLPAQARFVLTAHYFGGRRYEDIAEALDVPLGTVKTQLHRARRRLRELLESELA